MSFSMITPAPPRLNRSQLFVLANKPALFAAAARSAADVVMFEIEDGVPPGEKSAARQNLVAALSEIAWSGRPPLLRRSYGVCPLGSDAKTSVFLWIAPSDAPR